jgi:hypothetical protein
MPAKIVKIQTAMIARLPQAKGGVWEVGRRRLDISIAEAVTQLTVRCGSAEPDPGGRARYRP